jgi:hypothetical protein
MRVLFGQIGTDFLVVQPLLFYPIFYTFKETIDPDVAPTPPLLPPTSEHSTQNHPNHAQAAVRSPDEIVRKALSKYSGNFWQDNLGMCGFWFPALTVIYSVPIQ